MTVRLTTSTAGDATTIRLEGRLGVAELPDLRQECASATRPLRLDLSGLVSVDDEGVRMLRTLAAEGVELRGASAYVRQLLDAASPGQ